MTTEVKKSELKGHVVSRALSTNSESGPIALSALSNAALLKLFDPSAPWVVSIISSANAIDYSCRILIVSHSNE